MPGFSQWLSSPLGEYVIGREQGFFDRAVEDAFGYRAVQIGLPDMPLLRNNRIPLHLRLGLQGGVDVLADPAALPFPAKSLDLLLLPHVLDFTAHPHQVLREAERVLVPEGRLVLTGFNPFSLWGVRQLLGPRHALPWNGRFIGLPRLKDWLSLLDFELADSVFMCHAPPLQSEVWRARVGFLEEAGERCWPAAAGVYGLEAVKRVRGMRLSTPRWKTLAQPLISAARDKRPAVAAREPNLE